MLSLADVALLAADGHGVDILVGAIQGLGTGSVYVPMSTMTFAPLPAALRNEGTAITALVRNLGASIGIATAQGLLVHNMQVVHARLAAQITPYSPIRHRLAGAASAKVAALLNTEVTAQSTMVAYIDDFHFMMVLTVMVLPLLFLVRSPRPGSTGVQELVFD